MNVRIFLLLLAVCGMAGAARAELTGASVAPRQVQLKGSGVNIVTVNWRVAASADHQDGVTSPGAEVIDPGSGDILLRSDEILAAAGGGPFSLRESLTFDATTVRGWLDQGITRVVLQRRFGSPVDRVGTSATAFVLLSRSGLESLRTAAPGALAVQGLRLEFGSGNNTAVADLDESLHATLTVAYSGTGVLRGRWQVAEPGATEGSPLYRTLALVNLNLTAAQRTVTQSPVLPTNRSGSYLLRFCVDAAPGATADSGTPCTDDELLVTAAYQVLGMHGATLRAIDQLAPDRVAVGTASTFSWQPLAGASVYQLQIFSAAPADAALPASRSGATAEPEFVTGMLLDHQTTETPLSGLVQSRLRAGDRYLWRITAHDELGRMIGISTEHSFYYRPE